MTESEASKFTCPFTRTNHVGSGCIGRKCMLWENGPTQTTEAIRVSADALGVAPSRIDRSREALIDYGRQLQVAAKAYAIKTYPQRQIQSMTLDGPPERAAVRINLWPEDPVGGCGAARQQQ